ncbi:MAG: GNAT family N-acetyltransferase [Planctomycetota bacterium]
MKIELTRTAAIDPTEWDALLNASHDATPFHTRHWQAIYDRAGVGAESFALLARSPSRELLAAMPLTKFRKLGLTAFVASGFSVYGHPLTRPDAPPDALDALLAEYAALASGPLTVLSRVVDLRGLCAPLRRHGYEELPLTTHVVPLSPRWEDVRDCFGSSARNALEQALHSDLVVESSSDDADMAAFAALSSANYRAHSRRPYPKSLYPALMEELDAERLWFDVARYRGRVVAGSIHVLGPTQIVYWMTACDPAFRRLRPNDLLIASALERACRAGKRSYDLGPSPPGAEGLRAFKRKWGAREVPYSVYEKSRLPWRIARCLLH